jgi:hypothetical protein
LTRQGVRSDRSNARLRPPSPEQGSLGRGSSEKKLPFATAKCWASLTRWPEAENIRQRAAGGGSSHLRTRLGAQFPGNKETNRESLRFCQV